MCPLLGYTRAAERLVLRGARVDNVIYAAGIGRTDVVRRMLATRTGTEGIVRRTDDWADHFSFPAPRDADAFQLALIIAAIHDRVTTVPRASRRRCRRELHAILRTDRTSFRSALGLQGRRRRVPRARGGRFKGRLAQEEDPDRMGRRGRLSRNCEADGGTASMKRDRITRRCSGRSLALLAPPVLAAERQVVGQTSGAFGDAVVLSQGFPRIARRCSRAAGGRAAGLATGAPAPGPPEPRRRGRGCSPGKAWRSPPGGLEDLVVLEAPTGQSFA